MRKTLKKMKTYAQAHVSWLVALSLLLFLVTGGLLAAINFGAFTTKVPTPETYTFTSDWTILDLERHLEAGDVATISMVQETTSSQPVAGRGMGATATDNGASTVLAAKTTSGQWVRVNLSVTPTDALVALRSLGYGPLIAIDSVSQIPTTYTPASSSSASLLGTLLTIVIIGSLLGLVIFIFRRSRNGNQTEIGKFKGGAGTNLQIILPPDPENPNRLENNAPRPVSFADVAGCDEAKRELTEVVEFLKAPEKFSAVGALMPRGVLLYGDPGGGKTLLARATAMEAGVPFCSVPGSGFVEMYVGVGAQRVRNLFTTAKKFGKAIIFIDEIDALGKTRGGPNSNDEREQTLNQLLAEMDGFGSSENIIVIGATNRLDTLDPALLRPGRFSRKVAVPKPDPIGRRAILDIHAKGKPLAAEIDLNTLARKTAGMSGADLADLLNEAAIFAARRDDKIISLQDVNDGWLKSIAGTSRQRSMDERERSIIAGHEVGHALLGKLFGVRQQVEVISLYAHGDALGVTASSQEDDNLPSEKDIHGRLVQLMGGRAAEAILFDNVTAGASNDLSKAEHIATLMVTKWGMGVDPLENKGRGKAHLLGRGPLSLRVLEEGTEISAEVRGAMDRAIAYILDEAYKQARETLLSERERLNRIAGYLFENEKIDNAEFEKLYAGTLTPSPKMMDDWRSVKSHPRSWEEIANLAAAVKVKLPPVVVTPLITPSITTAEEPRPRKRNVLAKKVPRWRRLLKPTLRLPTFSRRRKSTQE
jgi:cell division protease FtsH